MQNQTDEKMENDMEATAIFRVEAPDGACTSPEQKGITQNQMQNDVEAGILQGSYGVYMSFCQY